MAGIEIFLCGRLIRLFLERLDGINRIFAALTFAGIDTFYVTKPRAGKSRLDPESNHPVRIIVDISQGILDRLLQHLGRLYNLIGCNHSHRRLRIVFHQNSRYKPDRPGGVAHGRLGDNIVGR